MWMMPDGDNIEDHVENGDGDAVDVADDVDAGDYFEDADATGDTVDAAEDYLEDVDAADDEVDEVTMVTMMTMTL